MDIRDIDPIEYQSRIKAARLLAEWEIGDREWADRIVWAFLNPEGVTREVRNQQSEGD